MRIYDIHPTDRTVIDPAGREAPLDPMRRDPRIPAGATSIEPPEVGEHEVARWTGEAWEVVPNWRGHVYWTEDGKKHEITELGVEPPADALDEEPPIPIEKIATDKLATLEQSLASALATGMPYTMPDATEEVVQTRPGDEPNLLGLAIEARDLRDAGETGAVLQLRVKSNVVYDLTPLQMIELTDAAKRFKKQLLGKSWVLKDQVRSIVADEDLADDEKRAAIEAVSW